MRLDDPAPPPGRRLNGDWRPVRIRDVIDTRPIDWDTLRHLTGQGDARPCDRCGREHEVHVVVEGDDGAEHVVGVTCAWADGPVKAQLTSVASAVRRVGQLEAQLARRRDWDRRYAEAKETALTNFPGHIVRQNPHYVVPLAGSAPGSDQEWASADDAAVVMPVHRYGLHGDEIDEPATLETLRHTWARSKALQQLGPEPASSAEDLERKLTRAQRRLKQLREQTPA